MRTMGLLLLAMAMAAGCGKHIRNNLPPAEMLMHPGPGVDGPGPGVMMYQPPMAPVGAVSQISFIGPEGMTVRWDVSAPGSFDSEALVAPARYNFPQGNIYRLKLANVPGRAGVELYPTLELAPARPRSEAFLAHNPIPIQFTEEDLDQVLSGNFVTKVIYLPNPEFQELALAGVETLVSTRLDPGVDPIIEAERRGSILAIVRLGNIDLQVPGSVSAQGVPMAAGPGYQGPGAPAPYVAGVSMPQYGMPMSGTPIGLPGPPHVPLGVPAGLQRHTIVNHTHVNLPEPTKSVRIDVKQKPGMSYPQPVNHVRIVESTTMGARVNHQPLADAHQRIGVPCESGACPVGDPSGGQPAGEAMVPETPCATPATPGN